MEDRLRFARMARTKKLEAWKATLPEMSEEELAEWALDGPANESELALAEQARRAKAAR